MMPFEKMAEYKSLWRNDNNLTLFSYARTQTYNVAKTRRKVRIFNSSARHLKL